jgi:hypothetical protein
VYIKKINIIFIKILKEMETQTQKQQFNVDWELVIESEKDETMNDFLTRIRKPQIQTINQNQFSEYPEFFKIN